MLAVIGGCCSSKSTRLRGGRGATANRWIRTARRGIACAGTKCNPRAAAMPVAETPAPARRARLLFGAGVFAAGVALAIWLPLGILDIVPFALSVPGVLQLRLHAGAAVACLLLAAWAFWES